MKFLPGPVIILALCFYIPRNIYRLLVVVNDGGHLAVVVLHLVGPDNVGDAVLAIALGNDIEEGDNAIRGVVGAWEDLFVYNVGNSVLLAGLARDILGRGRTSLNTRLGEVVRVVSGVVDEAPVEGLTGLDVEGVRIRVVGGFPLRRAERSESRG